METLEGIWGLFGLVAVLVLLVLAIFKKVSWKNFGISAVVYIVILFIIGEIVVSNPALQTPEKRIFAIQSTKSDCSGDDLSFDTNDDGDYTLKLKGLGDGQVIISTNEDKKLKTVDIRKDKTSKVKIHVPSDTGEYELIATDNGNHSKEFTIDNLSEDYLNRDTSDDDSSDEAYDADDYTDGEQYQKSLDTRVKHWNEDDSDDSVRVSKAWKDGGKTIVAVNASDWDDLTNAQQYAFTRDWAKATHNMSGMVLDGDSTTLRVVSSSDHSHVLARGTKSGKVAVE